MTIVWNKVDSSVIKNAVYDIAAGALAIHFHTGSVWIYLNVDLEVYDELINAHSVGQYFNKHIRNVYEAHKFNIEDGNKFFRGKYFGQET